MAAKAAETGRVPRRQPLAGGNRSTNPVSDCTRSGPKHTSLPPPGFTPDMHRIPKTVNAPQIHEPDYRGFPCSQPPHCCRAPVGTVASITMPIGSLSHIKDSQDRT